MRKEGRYSAGAAQPGGAKGVPVSAKSAESDIEGAPLDVAAIRGRIRELLDSKDEQGRKVGDAKFGVYAFYDYDGEPIYVGETKEKVRTRIGRHLTGQRSDAVAKFVLDPFEVAEIELWPFFDLQGRSKDEPEVKDVIARAEWTLYQKVVAASRFSAVLNEAIPMKMNEVELPKSFRQRIIPDDIYALRKHSDVRIARRASTISSLARVISEREVSKGLRKTLLTQAQRIEHLAQQRLNEIGGEIPVEHADSETGEDQ